MRGLYPVGGQLGGFVNERGEMSTNKILISLCCRVFFSPHCSSCDKVSTDRTIININLFLIALWAGKHLLAYNDRLRGLSSLYIQIFMEKEKCFSIQILHTSPNYIYF